MIHAARGNRQAERKRLQDARVMGIALHQPFHRHPVTQRLLRVVSLLHRARAVGEHIAESLALARHEQQLLDQRRITQRSSRPWVWLVLMMPRWNSSNAHPIAEPLRRCRSPGRCRRCSDE
jgi:hypothetical protein